jgi:hypothetical protein
MLVGRYVYANEGGEIASVLHALFSDQSGLTYISEALKAENATQLLIQHEAPTPTLRNIRGQRSTT